MARAASPGVPAVTAPSPDPDARPTPPYRFLTECPELASGAADDLIVVTFWKWFVRNPAFLAAGVAFFCGLAQIAEWSLALTGAAIGAVVGDFAWHLAHKAEARGERRRAQREADAAAVQRFTDYARAEQEKVA